HVYLRMRPRLRQDRPGRPFARLIDEVFADIVTGGIQPRHDGFRRTDGNLVLAAASAVDYGDSGFHRIFLPMADMIISTAKSAVRLISSITGLTSTTSMESMRPLSQISSMARCASRYVAPPRTGVPTPGANCGS